MSLLLAPMVNRIATPYVTFDGTNDYWTRGADLTGISDSQYLAGYAKFDILNNAAAAALYTFTSEKIRFRLETNGLLTVVLKNSGGTQLLAMQTTGAMDDGNPHEAHWSFNGSTGAYEFYVDGAQEASGTATAGTVDCTAGDVGVGAAPAGGTKFAGDIARVALWQTDATGFADFDVTTAAGRANMANPAMASGLGNGSENYLDMYGAVATWNAGTNQGSGGNGTMNGAVA